MEPYAILAGIIAAYLFIRLAVAGLSRLFARQLAVARPTIQPLIAPLHALLIAGLIFEALGRAGKSTFAAWPLVMIAAAWTAIRLVTVLAAELYFRPVHGFAMPSVLRTIISRSLYLLALIAAVYLWTGLSLGDLLVFTAAGGVALGIIFQSYIGNLITGLSISLRYQLGEGDVIQIAGVEGRVIEVDWRFTEIITRENAVVTVPNRVMSEAVVTNHARPDRSHFSTVYFSVDASSPPNRVKAILEQCVAVASEGLSLNPRAAAGLEREEGGRLVYALSFWSADYENAPALEERVRSLAWYRLRRERMIRDGGAAELADRAIAAELEDVPIFSGVSAEHLSGLGRLARLELYGKGELVFRQGDRGDALYVVRSGAVAIITDGPVQRAVIRAGDVFGERSVLTEEPRSAHAQALEDSELIAISKQCLLGLLRADPLAAERISAVIAEREQANASQPASPADREREERSFLDSIRRVFNL
jgi:small-conductance mechanosensitive channel/CRP-like cAMP-binding protein